MKTIKYYKCIEDRQGGSWAVGSVGDVEYWRERAMEWADSDESWETYYYLKRAPKKDIIEYIDDVWDITIVEDDGEHFKELISNVIGKLADNEYYLKDDLRELQWFLNDVVYKKDNN